MQEEEDLHYLWPFRGKKICFLGKQELFVEGGIAGRIWNGQCQQAGLYPGQEKGHNFLQVRVREARPLESRHGEKRFGALKPSLIEA